MRAGLRAGGCEMGCCEKVHYESPWPGQKAWRHEHIWARLPHLGPSDVHKYVSGRRGTTSHPTCTHTSIPFVHSTREVGPLTCRAYSTGADQLPYSHGPADWNIGRPSRPTSKRGKPVGLRPTVELRSTMKETLEPVRVLEGFEGTS